MTNMKGANLKCQRLQKCKQSPMLIYILIYILLIISGIENLLTYFKTTCKLSFEKRLFAYFAHFTWLFSLKIPSFSRCIVRQLRFSGLPMKKDWGFHLCSLLCQKNLVSC